MRQDQNGYACFGIPEGSWLLAFQPSVVRGMRLAANDSPTDPMECRLSENLVSVAESTLRARP